MIIKVKYVALCDEGGADCLGNHFVILNNAKPIRVEKAVCMKCGHEQDCQIFRSKDVRQRDRAIIQCRPPRKNRTRFKKPLAFPQAIVRAKIKRGSDFHATTKNKKVSAVKRRRKNRRK